MDRPQGWTAGAEVLFPKVVDYFGDDAHFVEVGVWLGASTLVMWELIQASGKHIRQDCVDHWRGTANEPAVYSHRVTELAEQGFTPYSKFLHNMRDWGALSDLYTYCLPSLDAVRLYDNESLDFVYLDADHSRSGARADIMAWAQKIIPGGILAGDDYPEEGLEAAVASSLLAAGYKVETFSRAWAVFDWPGFGPLLNLDRR